MTGSDASETGIPRNEDELRVVDLFCGAGGASAGAWQAGAELVAGVDWNEDALETHAANLTGEHIQHDLRNVQPAILPPLRVDWVHGSPPCQGFSQAKGGRNVDDARNQLVWSFIDWCEAINPKIVTMENVAGMQSISSHFLERVQGAFRDAGFEARWRLLNAADYGVPQTRERVYFVAVREDLEYPAEWFPRPTHAETPTSTLTGERLTEWRTVREAIGDLAADIPTGADITSQQNEAHQKAGRRPWHSVEEPARTIRCGTPPEVETDGGATVPNHVPQDHREETRERFATIEPGTTTEGISNRRLHPEAPSPTICADEGSAVPPIHYVGPTPPNHDPVYPSDEVQDRMRAYEPGGTYDSVTERRLAGDEPAKTVVASHTQMIIGSDVADRPSCTVTTRGHLRERGHHESISDGDVRRLTVREAARLQSFDDWFVFEGTKTSQLQQVGNAVPPRLQQHIAGHVHRIIRGEA